MVRGLTVGAGRELGACEQAAAVVCQVLAGLGGVGKTLLAASLAHRWWREQRVDLLMWVTATSRTGVLTRFAHAATDVTGVEDPDPADGAQRLLAWLAGTGRRWLPRTIYRTLVRGDGVDRALKGVLSSTPGRVDAASSRPVAAGTLRRSGAWWCGACSWQVVLVPSVDRRVREGFDR